MNRYKITYTKNGGVGMWNVEIEAINMKQAKIKFVSEIKKFDKIVKVELI